MRRAIVIVGLCAQLLNIYESIAIILIIYAGKSKVTKCFIYSRVFKRDTKPWVRWDIIHRDTRCSMGSYVFILVAGSDAFIIIYFFNGYTNDYTKMSHFWLKFQHWILKKKTIYTKCLILQCIKYPKFSAGVHFPPGDV